MLLALHAEQVSRWPKAGRHILASFDDHSIVVYQAYRASIGLAAARDQAFGGGGFSFSRMSWIKPNFLWMMYRSGWGTKEGQEITLAVRIQRAGFDRILAEAVHSSFVPEVYATREAWDARVASSEVRLQWDPDHGPSGQPLERRAIQLGLRGQALASYAGPWIVGIEDVSEQVRELAALRGTAALRTPVESVYPVSDPETARKLGLSAISGS